MVGKVNFSHQQCIDGSLIGIAELDNPSSLNALDYPMIDQLYHQLLEWQEDDKVIAVMLHGHGERAFCAGGDVQAMYRALEIKEQDFDSAYEMTRDFFTLEYRCDYLLHTYRKPVIAWGHGYLMGGGVGLFMGASHRVVDSNTRFAMPEVKIGLYPDVGGTYFLNQIPRHYALFIALTACQINAADMQSLELSHWVISAERKQDVLESLAQIEWKQCADIGSAITDVLQSRHQADHQEGWLIAHSELVSEICQGELSQMVAAITALETDDKWLINAKKTTSYASPLSLHLCYQQLTKYSDLTLKQCFELEFGLTLRCGLEGDFREGVRALLIDKTNQPSWMHSDVTAVTCDDVTRFFSPLDSVQYPLAKAKSVSAIL
ncbi:enoyl-CoA hydratase/isomerase family protein [Vibrio rhodolitus]|uniref:enoyl-CoA hydratase/isomerase family protein n=1 Tax=Vibrio rhodolitus TaxID=2231649 RepID=UPI000E0C71B9|nr:enoyl-CoA hydratase/isomerase family protein [Vibrio rhodolitus]